MNPYVPSTQFQQLKTHGQACFLYTAISEYFMHIPDIKLFHP